MPMAATAKRSMVLYLNLYYFSPASHSPVTNQGAHHLHPSPLLSDSSCCLPSECIAPEATTTLPSPLSLCPQPPNSSALCPSPPSSCLVIHRHIALRCSPPDCSTLSATRSSCIIYRPLLSCCPPPACLALFIAPTQRVIQCPLAPHTIYHDLIVAFILSLPPLPPCHLIVIHHSGH